MAEFIMKLNGVKNSTYTLMYDRTFDDYIDHCFCVFNRDGSKFNGKINKHTIIIDPWSNNVDFAFKMLKHYKNMSKFYYDISEKSELILVPQEMVKLSRTQLKKMKKLYPDFIFKSKNRKFMCNPKT